MPFNDNHGAHLMLRFLIAPLAFYILLIPAVLRAAPALVAPTLLLPYEKGARLIDYRPAINAAGTRIVFERTFPVTGQNRYSETPNLFIVDLANPPPQPLVPALSGTARADWCWWPNRPGVEGPIAFSTSDGVYTTAPAAGSTPRYLRNSATWIYPTWFPGCGSLAVDATESIPYGRNPHNTNDTSNPGPATLKINAFTSFFERSLSGQMNWAGFASVNSQAPRLIAFAGQQFQLSGYNQDLNYVYIADNATVPPRVKPLDSQASIASFDPRFQGRAPTWSPDGRWIAFESNRNCANKNFYAIFIEDGQGLRPGAQVTDCSYNAQHAKWYRLPVGRRNLLIATVLLDPAYSGTDLLQLNARGIASLDVTAFLNPQSR